MQKKFAYFIQAADYIPHYVSELEKNADVYILTYQSPVDHPNNIFMEQEHCSWTDGRNALAAKAGTRDYLYHIFMDDDVHLMVDSGRTYPYQNPWRVFEEFLLEYMPAVGTARYPGQNYFDPEEDVNLLYGYDAILNAVHKDVMPIYFPQCNAFDNISWWWSQVLSIYTMGVFFPATVLQCNKLIIENQRRGEYPQARLFTFASKIFKKSLIFDEDRDKVIPRGRLKTHPDGPYKYPSPQKYVDMASAAKRKVDPHAIIWKNHPHFN